MKRRLSCFIILNLFVPFILVAQQDFYNINSVQEIRLTFKEQNWKHILDSLFDAAGDEGRLPGDVTINGQFIKDVGVRYKGYSSWNQDEIKNPFNIELDYSMKNRNYQGYTKIKLSNVIHDPSFVREVLGYEIARKYMPASRANFANLYVNDTLIGLYTNVESVDKKFVTDHFGSGDRAFFKGEPVKLVYPFGENANLAYTHGTDSSGYIPFYKIESDVGWRKLLTLISRLDQGADSVEPVLNTDRTLWMHALNFVILNLDSYIGYSQNYYLCEDINGRFNPIPWDLNMSFGSFRNSDGSTHFTGISIPQEKVLNPLEHLTFCVSPRPLMVKLFSSDTHRKKFIAHMRTIIDENIRNDAYYTRGVTICNLIDPYVKNDTNKFYSYEDYVKNIDTTVGGTGEMILYPGLKNLMTARMAYLDHYDGFSGAPVISNIIHFPEYPEKGKEVWITAKISRASAATLEYRNRTGDVFTKTPMIDDGEHQDGISGDGICGARIIPSGNTFQYYIYAENDSAGMFSPERAEYEYYTIQPVIGKGEVAINEIRATNTSSGAADENIGSWMELCNNSTEDLLLKGMSLSDDPAQLSKWPFPDTIIKAKSYLIAWMARYEPVTGMYTNFSLYETGGKLFLSNALGSVIDSLTYGPMVPVRSFGRYPNGYGSFAFMDPSFSMYNNPGTMIGSDFLIYPNPAHNRLYIEMETGEKPLEARIFNINGKLLISNGLSWNAQVRELSHSFDITALAAGTYAIQVICNDKVETKKFIVY